jgi:hypothetical protein
MKEERNTDKEPASRAGLFDREREKRTEKTKDKCREKRRSESE